MRIAGISVDVENLPSRDVLFGLAMRTREYCDNPLYEEQINLAIDDSGYYKNVVVEPEKENVEDGLHTRVTAKVKKSKSRGKH